MMRNPKAIFAALLGAAVLLAAVPQANAHCDTMDGPVVKAGQKAMAAGQVELALIWVKAEAEPELRAAFAQAVAVRKQGGAAAALAETWFLETLVRLHRAGEGEPYTGLKPAGGDLGPAIPAADAAITSGKIERVRTLLTGAVQKGLEHRFHRVQSTRKYAPTDVAAGRAYVDAYVQYVHYVERLHADAAGAAHGHAAEPAAHAGH